MRLLRAADEILAGGAGAGGSIGTRFVAPVLAALALLVVAVLILLNFDLMIGADGPSPLVVVMPGIIIGSGLVGLVWGEILRRRRPDVYAAMDQVDQIPESQEIPIVAPRA